MSTSVLTRPPQETAVQEPPRLDLRVVLAGVGISLLFAGLLVLWFAFDSRLPGIDESGHIINSMDSAEILRRFKFWKPMWWHSLITVNQFYPPFAYVFAGAMKLALGPSYWVDIFNLAVYDFALGLSIFGTTWLLTRSSRASLFATALVNLYPQALVCSHSALLDFPVMAVVSVGLFFLTWWNDKPSLPRALAAGLVVMLACMTKQIVFAFFVGPALICLARAIKHDWEQRKPQWVYHLGAMGMISLACGVPWLLTNMHAIKGLAKYNQAAIGAKTLGEAFTGNLSFYAAGFPHIMSPLLFAAFMAALLFVQETTRKQLLPVMLSSMGGLVLISLLTWAFPLDRYTPPALLAPAVYTGCMLARASFSTNPFVLVVPWFVMLMACLQLISFCYMPYPITGPEPLAKLSDTLGVSLRQFRGGTLTNNSPRPPEDWGQAWVLNCIEDTDGKIPIWMNVLPCTNDLNVHTFEWLARLNHSLVRPTTSRMWTVMGDKVEFAPKTAMYYQWYLLKTGAQGNIMQDKNSDRAYTELNEYVQKSGRFKKTAARLLPDGSTMSLYRQL